MNSKIWLMVYGIVAALVILGSGFYAFSSYGKYTEALSSWDSKVGSIESLERKTPYPNKENAEALEAKVKSYSDAVTALSETLKSFQRPLNTTLANTEFQQRVKKGVEDFRAVAKEGGMELATATEFQLGFDNYANTLPSPDLVPVLDYELEAIQHLLRTLVNSGGESMSSFVRDPIPGEPGGAEKQESGVVHKYPVRLQFRGSFDAFQKFVNTLANDKTFFYIVRVLKVKNEATEGAAKLTGGPGGSSFPRFQNPDTKETASPEKLTEWGYGTATEPELIAKAKEAGFVKADQDARVLMGQEKLDVFMVVDITRFLSPEEVKAQTPEPEVKKTGRR